MNLKGERIMGVLMEQPAQPRGRAADYGHADAPMAPTAGTRETVLMVIDQVIGHQHETFALVARIESAIGLPQDPPAPASEKAPGIAHGALSARSQALYLNERLARIADMLG